MTPDEPSLATPDARLSFASDVKPLFRESDRTAMRRAFDLWSYGDVVAHGQAIAARLKDGSMPCDGRWPADRVAVFERWLNDGLASVTPGPVLVFGATGTRAARSPASCSPGRSPCGRWSATRGLERARALLDLGAELVVGDLQDEWSLARALSTVRVAYAITTPFEERPRGRGAPGDTIIRAASQAGLPWLILASVASAGRAPVPHFQSKAQIEARLRDSPVPWTVVAPSYFYENVLGSRDSLRQGVLPMPLPVQTPLHQVALRDLGAVVAAILDRRDEHLSARIEIAGDAPTPAKMAAALGVARRADGRSETLSARNPDLAAMYAFLADTGYGIDVPAVRARYPEVNLSTLRNGRVSWRSPHNPTRADERPLMMKDGPGPDEWDAAVSGGAIRINACGALPPAGRGASGVGSRYGAVGR